MEVDGRLHAPTAPPPPIPGKTPGFHWVGCWVRPRAVLTFWKSISCLCWDSNPESSSTWFSRRTDYDIPAPTILKSVPNANCEFLHFMSQRYLLRLALRKKFDLTCTESTGPMNYKHRRRNICVWHLLNRESAVKYIKKGNGERTIVVLCIENPA